MKKVLSIFTTGFVSWGGLTTVMMNYYRNIEDSDVKIDFASTNEPDRKLRDEIESRGSKYFKLPSRGKLLPLYYLNLIKICKNYDIVHVHGNSATSIIELYAAIAAGVKHRYIHNHNSVTAHPYINWIIRPFFRKTYTRAFACSFAAGEWLFGSRGYSLLHNAIDVDRFRSNKEIRCKIRNSLGIKNDSYVIGHIGKFVPAKNHRFLIEVFSFISEIKSQAILLLVGDGIMKKDIENQVKQLGLEDKVIMTGLRTDIYDLVQAMDVFIFPSIHEGLPLSVLEAQASGLPCFLSDAITKEVGIGEDVYFVRKEYSAKKWSEIICNCTMEVTREERCNQNYKLITKAGYNIKVEANELLKLYKSQYE